MVQQMHEPSITAKVKDNEWREESVTYLCGKSSGWDLTALCQKS